MAITPKPPRARSQTQLVRDAMLDRDMRDITARLTNIEKIITDSAAKEHAYSMMSGRIAHLEEKIKDKVSFDQFILVRNIVFGGVATILLTVLGALLGLVLIGGK
jgi:hypothetical protein